MATVDFRVGDRAHITVDSDVCRSCTTKDCVTACPANLFAPTSDGGHPLQLRGVLRVRDLLHGLRPGGRHHLDLSRRRPRRRLPPRMTATCTGRPRCPAGGGLPPDHRPPARGGPARPARYAGTAGASGSPPPTRRRWSTPSGSATRGRVDFWPSPSGRKSVEPVLRQVAALGASVLRVPSLHHGLEHGYPRELGEDEHELARMMVAAIGPFGPPSVVMCGDRSADRGTGAFPAFVAHELGAAQALGLVALEVTGAPGGHPAGSRPSAGSTGDGASSSGCRCLRCVRWRRPGVRLRRASLAGVLDTEAMVVPVAGARPAVIGGYGQGQVQVGPTRPFAPRTRVLPAPGGTIPGLDCWP